MKDIPVLFDKKDDCCGCGACVEICARRAISMRPDEEGFVYPSIDAEKCVGCRRCLSVCPLKNKTVTARDTGM